MLSEYMSAVDHIDSRMQSAAVHDAAHLAMASLRAFTFTSDMAEELVL